MVDWDSHEIVALLVDIVKLCDQSLLGYLAQCLVQRYEQRFTVIYVFPDNITLCSLIFIYI